MPIADLFSGSFELIFTTINTWMQTPVGCVLVLFVVFGIVFLLVGLLARFVWYFMAAVIIFFDEAKNKFTKKDAK